MTGGSHAEARASAPPFFGVLGLFSIQSGYGALPWALACARTPPAATAAALAALHPRNFRRFIRRAILGLPSHVVSRPSRRSEPGLTQRRSNRTYRQET